MNVVFHQCEVCLEYCDAHGNRLRPQPKYGKDRIGVPEILTCFQCRTGISRLPERPVAGAQSNLEEYIR